MGRERQNVEGQYVVNAKTPQPTYYGLGRVINGGDPDNPLGAYLIGLTRPVENGVAGQFGIHGTDDPANVQRDDPRGYIRLAPRDAEDAFTILSVGSTVTIRR